MAGPPKRISELPAHTTWAEGDLIEVVTPGLANEKGTLVDLGAFLGAGAGAEDVVWVGPEAPADPAVELWYDTDAVAGPAAGNPYTPLDQTTWTWVNQGGASVAQNGGIVALTLPGTAGETNRGRVTTAPSVPYTITVAVLCDLRASTESRIGVCWRLSSDPNKMEVLNARGNNGVELASYPSQANYVGAAGLGSVGFAALPALVWLRLVDDGTNRKALVSLDGLNFRELSNRTRASFFGAAPDQVGIVGLSNVSPYTLGSFLSWKVT